jgi:hypothetical protein
MTNKTQALYESCLRRLMEVCQQETGRVPEPRLLVANYELAILQAMSSVFPTVGRARGCYYYSGSVILHCGICRLLLKLKFYFLRLSTSTPAIYDCNKLIELMNRLDA